jgi:predicted nucleic acid-binding protein
MIRHYGIDTSILLRLVTGDPAASYQLCVTKLSAWVNDDGHEIFASNQVIGEAYIALQHHYGVGKRDARTGLISVLTSGLVAPLNGKVTLTALELEGGCGLIDRLIAEDYSYRQLQTLTLDKKMGSLPGTVRLSKRV